MPGLNTVQKLGWAIKARIGGGIGFEVSKDAPVNGTSGSLGYCCGALWIRVDPATSPSNYAVYQNAGSPTNPSWVRMANTTDALALLSTLSVAGVLTPTGGIAAAGGFSLKPMGLVHTGGVPVMATADGTNATSNTTGTMYLSAVVVPGNMTITGARIYNGTAVAGNGKVALFSWDGATTLTNVAVSASTAMSGTTAYQSIAFASPYSAKGPAVYWVGATFDDSTHDLRTHSLGTFPCEGVTGVTFATNSTFATLTIVGTAFNAGTGLFISLY